MTTDHNRNSKPLFGLALLIGVFLYSITLAQAQTTTAPEKVVRLKTPIAFPSYLPALGTPILYVAEQLELISKGSIQMKVYEPGKLVAPFEILDAVSSGKLNSGYSAAGYWAGQLPAAPLFSAAPFGPGVNEFLAWHYRGDGQRLYQKMYDRAGFNVKVLPCALISAESSGWFAEPIETPEQLRGLNVRYYGLSAKVLKKLGASPTLIPGGELFGAMEKGAVDAAEYSQPAIDYRLGLHKIVKYLYFPAWHQQASILELLINGDTWREMSAAQRATIDTVCRASVVTSLAEGEALQSKYLKKYKEEHGVVQLYWSDEFLTLFYKTWLEVVAEEREKDEFFREVWDNLSAFRKEYSIWKEKAFLPLEY